MVASVSRQTTFVLQRCADMLREPHSSSSTSECFAYMFCMLRDSIAIVASH
jgi:hypothetical protein